MRSCIESNQFIFGITDANAASERLLLLLPRLGVLPWGCARKGDAFIGAFTEWQGARYLITAL
jgi:hypothetical protein